MLQFNNAFYILEKNHSLLNEWFTNNSELNLKLSNI